MEFMTGVRETEVCGYFQVFSKVQVGTKVRVHGMVYAIRQMGTLAFIILRGREGQLQCVYEEGNTHFDLKRLKEESAVIAEGIAAENTKAPGGMEIRLQALTVLSEPAEPMPVQVAKRKINTSLEKNLNLRPLTLRNLRERAIFKLQEGIVKGFREVLDEQGFTEIHTPKIGARAAEGGANIFKLDYFHKPAVLAQSPQFYKQMMVGVFDRVYETAPVFRAEKHNTKRHLNEYTSLDFEMGYITDFSDIMAMETAIFQRIVSVLQARYGTELAILEVELPKTDRIPCVKFEEAKKLVSQKYNRLIRNPYDLEPEEELLIGSYFKEEYGEDFVFVTHYPSKKRPFYAMEDTEDAAFTLSFDCLFRGVEITTGGQRIHDYHRLTRKIAERGMSTEGMESYLLAFKHGLPPHGGLGIGLERFTMQLLQVENVRETTLFPRDLSRLEP